MARKRTKRLPGERANVAVSDLLEIAIHLLSKQGVQGTSFQMIANQAGLSQTAVLHYFKDKLSLIHQVCMHVIQSNRSFVEGTFKTGDTSLARFRKHFLGNFLWARERPHHASMILLLYYMGSTDPEFAELYRLILEKARGRIEELYLVLAQESQVKSKCPPPIAAEILHDLLVGALLNPVASQALGGDGEALLRKVDRVLAGLLQGSDKMDKIR